MQMSEYDRFAFSLALFRLCRVHADVIAEGDFREIWDAFQSLSGFWFLMREARKDISTALKERSANLETAFALVMHDDLSAPEETIRRDHAVITNAGF